MRYFAVIPILALLINGSPTNAQVEIPEPEIVIVGSTGVVMEQAGSVQPATKRLGTDFGRQFNGEDLFYTRDIFIYNYGFERLDISRFEMTGPNGPGEFNFTGNDPIPFIEAGGFIILSVGLAPETAGPKHATVNIKSNDPDNPVVSFDLRAQVVDLLPAESVELDLKLFTNPKIKYSAKKGLYTVQLQYLVTNTGNVAAELPLVRLFGSQDRLLSSADPFLGEKPLKPLKPGKGKKVKLKFTTPAPPTRIFGEVLSAQPELEDNHLNNIVETFLPPL